MISCFSSACWSEWGVAGLRRRFLASFFLFCRPWSHKLAHHYETLCFCKSWLCCASFRRRVQADSTSCTLWRSSHLERPPAVWILTIESCFPHRQRRRKFHKNSQGRAFECCTRGTGMIAFWHWWCRSAPGLCLSFALFQTQWPHPLQTRCVACCTESVWAVR